LRAPPYLTEDADGVVDMLAADPMGVADDVVVEDSRDLPAARLGRAGEQLPAPQPLLLARQDGIDDGGGELLAAEQPRRFEDHRHSAGVIVRSRRVAGGVGAVADPAVDMPLDDDDTGWIARPLLDREDILDADPGGRARAGEGVTDGLDGKAAAAVAADRGKPSARPAPRRTDAADRVGRRRQRMPRAETDQCRDRRSHRRRIGSWGGSGDSDCGNRQEQGLHRANVEPGGGFRNPPRVCTMRR
jgi:hypothetical protein